MTEEPDDSNELPTIPQEGGPSFSAAGNPVPGTEIGPYRLIEILGQGGFGIVYRAEQREPVQRQVALKLIKPGMGSGEIIARFEAERQALALMNHPCIARVFDAGATEDGLPYFVMELVRGQPITDYCDQRQLRIRDRLALMAQVCSGIQHAHQRAIIHRDLKPGNVLVTEVDGRPVPKVIDFGIAKALGPSLTKQAPHTREGVFIGTPFYVSPEQASASADIDTRSDVYTLGVMLYELVTGETPFTTRHFGSAAFDEMLRIIRENEPPKPSNRVRDLDEDTAIRIARSQGRDTRHLQRSLSGELDWVIMKALDKDRERRYGTASALERDLSAILANEPVSAGPPSFLYQARKFVRRNQALVGSTCVVILSLLAGLHLSIGLMNRAREAEALARHERNEVEKILSFMTYEVREKLQEYVPLPVRRDLLEKVENYYRKTGRDRGGQSGRLLSAHYSGLGVQAKREKDWDTALHYFELSRNLSRDLVAGNPADLKNLRSLAGAEYNVGLIHEYLGDYEKAMEHTRAALRGFERLVELSPDERTEFLGTCVLARNSLGRVASLLGEDDLALEHANEALRIAETITAQEPENAEFLKWLVASHELVGQQNSIRGNTGEALEHYQSMLAVGLRLLDSAPENAKYAEIVADGHQRIGGLARTLKRPEAGKHLEAARSGFEALVEGDPERPEYQLQLALVHRDLGFLLWDERRWPEVLEHLETALRLRQQVDSSDVDSRLGLARSHAHVAAVLDAMRRTEESMRHKEKACSIFESILGLAPQHFSIRVNYSEVLCALASDFEKQGEDGKALLHWRRAVAMLQEVERNDRAVTIHRDNLARAHLGLAGLLADRGEEECLDQFGRAIELYAMEAGRDPVRCLEYVREQAEASYQLAVALRARERKEEALRQFLAAEKLYEQLVEASPGDLSSLNRISFCRSGRGMVLERVEDSLAAFESQIENVLLIRERFPRVRRQDSVLANGYSSAASCLERLQHSAEDEAAAGGHRARAIDYYRRTIRLLEGLVSVSKASDTDRELLEKTRMALARMERETATAE